MPRSPASKPTMPRSSGGVTRPRRRGRVDALAVAMALALLRGYKAVLSPFFAGHCRFQPSCSDYMAQSLRTHGVLAGGWLGVKRLSRCRPLGGHGIDPVPQP